VEQVVESNNKKRFELVQKDEQYWIRAVQGHTMQTVKDEDLLKPIDTKTVFQYQ
jgi:RNA:NAD 2'-phosphotransferase (TPT1/KptA family)